MPDIQIVQFDPATGLGTLALGNNPKLITGLELLAQIVALAYLKNPGQDVIDPTEGSGIRQDIGQTPLTSVDEANLLVMQRTKVVEAEILSRQTVGVGEPSEKLKKLVVLDVATDLTNARIVARVKVTNETGGATDILV